MNYLIYAASEHMQPAAIHKLDNVTCEHAFSVLSRECRALKHHYHAAHPRVIGSGVRDGMQFWCVESKG